MFYLGDIPPDETIDFKFVTRDPFSAAPATLSGSPAVALYNANNTTESATGVTLTTDFDGRTGMNHVRIVGTTAGLLHSSGYQVVITAGTVGGVSVVGTPIAHFSCHNRSVHEGIYYGSVTTTSTASSIVDSNANTVFAVATSAVGLVLKWLSGALKGQAGIIGTYTVSPNTFGFDTNNDFTGAPTTGDRFMVL